MYRWSFLEDVLLVVDRPVEYDHSHDGEHEGVNHEPKDARRVQTWRNVSSLTVQSWKRVTFTDTLATIGNICLISYRYEIEYYVNLNYLRKYLDVTLNNYNISIENLIRQLLLCPRIICKKYTILVPLLRSVAQWQPRDKVLMLINALTLSHTENCYEDRGTYDKHSSHAQFLNQGTIVWTTPEKENKRCTDIGYTYERYV